MIQPETLVIQLHMNILHQMLKTLEIIIYVTILTKIQFDDTKDYKMSRYLQIYCTVKTRPKILGLLLQNTCVTLQQVLIK